MYTLFRGRENLLISTLVLISFVLGTGVFAYSSTAEDSLYERAVKDPGCFTQIECKVKRIETKENSEGEKYYRIKAVASKGCGVLITCTDNDCEAMPGDTVFAGGSLDIPTGRRNPGCFDYRLYLRTVGVRTVMSAGSIQVISSGSFESQIYRYKESFLEKLSVQAGEDTAAMLDGILFGNKSEIDDETLDSFKKNGTMHILAVSGLHIGILYAFLLKLWILLGNLTNGMICNRRGWAFISFIGVFFWIYMILASFSPSVVRAVLMVLLHAAAQLSGRRYDINSAAFAVYLAVLLKNPYMLFNTGFEMSFLAVLSIALIIPYVNKVYKGLMGATIAVQIGLGPFILYNFNYLSLISVFLNVPVVLLAGIIVPLGVCQSLFVNVFGDNVAVISQVLEALCDLLRIMNAKASVDGVTTFTLASPDARLLFAYYLLLLIAATEEGRLHIMRTERDQRVRYILKLAIATIITTAAFGYLTDDGFAKAGITFVDVGQGDCMCIRCDPGHLHHCGPVYLIDGGGSSSYNVGVKTLREYLLKNGMSHVDGAFVTHLHTDHYKGICELAKAGIVDHLYVYEGYKSRESSICEDTGLKSKDITYLCADQKAMLYNSKSQNVSIRVLWPEKKTDSEYERLLADETNENDMSLLLKLDYNGVTMLATGDMDENGENAVIARYRANQTVLRSDILKVGHHGSKTSTSERFLNYVNPSVSVIQVGKNIYGHPTPETLSRLSQSGSAIYRNDTDGAIGIQTKCNRLSSIHVIY